MPVQGIPEEVERSVEAAERPVAEDLSPSCSSPAGRWLGRRRPSHSRLSASIVLQF